MWDNYSSDYYERRCSELREEIAALEAQDYKENHVTGKEAEEALSHHLEQLERLGATLEDDICTILRKLMASSKLREEIADRERLLKEYTSELWSAKGL